MIQIQSNSRLVGYARVSTNEQELNDIYRLQHGLLARYCFGPEKRHQSGFRSGRLPVNLCLGRGWLRRFLHRSFSISSSSSASC